MTDELTSEKAPEVETGPALLWWDEMVREFGDPLSTIEPPTDPPAFVEELDQTSVLDGVNTDVYLPGSTGRTPIPFGGSKKAPTSSKSKNAKTQNPEPKKKPTNWPKLPD